MNGYQLGVQDVKHLVIPEDHAQENPKQLLCKNPNKIMLI